MEINKIYVGNSLETLKTFPDGIMNCCVTSPPYFGLRDYGNDGQIGLEQTPEAYVAKIVEVFREVRRVLRGDGTLWLNIGDTYAGSVKVQTFGSINNKTKGMKLGTVTEASIGLKAKDLIGIPWMVAFALRADGWYLRQDIIWSKGNSMPESVTDRCTKSHEYIFVLAKSKKYYFDADAIKTPIKENRPFGVVRDRLLDYDSKEKQIHPDTPRGGFNVESDLPDPKKMANKRSVWSVNTKPYKGAHFATFPETLITDCIKAGCPKDGIVLDPFMGVGTTGLVARKQGKNFVGCELNPEYIKIAEDRIEKHLGIFTQQESK